MRPPASSSLWRPARFRVPYTTKSPLHGCRRARGRWTRGPSRSPPTSSWSCGPTARSDGQSYSIVVAWVACKGRGLHIDMDRGFKKRRSGRILSLCWNECDYQLFLSTGIEIGGGERSGKHTWGLRSRWRTRLSWQKLTPEIICCARWRMCSGSMNSSFRTNESMYCFKS